MDFVAPPAISPTLISTVTLSKFTSRAKTTRSHRRRGANDHGRTAGAGPDEIVVDDPDHVTFPDKKGKQEKIYVDGVEVCILGERVEYLDENGKLVTKACAISPSGLAEALRQPRRFPQTLEIAERKQAIIDELAEEGLLLDPLADEVGKNLDPST